MPPSLATTPIVAAAVGKVEVGSWARRQLPLLIWSEFFLVIFKKIRQLLLFGWKNSTTFFSLGEFLSLNRRRKLHPQLSHLWSRESSSWGCLQIDSWDHHVCKLQTGE